MVNPIPPDLVPPLPPDAPPFPKARRRKTLVPRRELITERRIKATQLRLAGLSCEEIGMRLHADPEVNVEGRAVIGGYGWLNHAKGKPPVIGLNLSKTVSVDLLKAAEARRETSERAQDEWLELELARIDKVQSAIWQQCLSGNLWAVDRFVALSARRAKMLGLDIERREVKGEVKHSGAITVEGHHPEMTGEFYGKLMAALGDLGQADIVDAEVVEDDGDRSRLALPQP